MKKLFIYSFIIVLLAFAVREMLYIGIRANRGGEFDKLNTLFAKRNSYDLIIIGSSRAESHYNTRIIDSLTHFNSYNFGLEGATYPLIKAAFESYLEHSNPPKYLIFNIDFFNKFKKAEDNSDIVYHFPRYLPYIEKNNTFYEDLKIIDKKYVYFKWNPFYSMTFMKDKYIYSSLKGYLGITSEFDKEYYKGYVFVPEPYQKNITLEKYAPYICSPDQTVYDCINSIVKKCAENKIKLIFIVSPMYYQETNSLINKDGFLSYIQMIARKNDFGYLNYLQHPMCCDSSVFSDPSHLNKKGSDLFSIIFSNDLLNLLTDL